MVLKKVEGKVDFISNSPLTKEELLALLIKVLNAKNFTLIEDGNILKVIPLIKKKIKAKTKNIEVIKQTKISKIIKLKHIETKTIMPIINNLVAYYKSKPFVSYEHESNMVILMGDENDIKEIENVINKIDIKKIQIYVEARIIEISEIKTKNLGLKYGLSAGLLSGSSLFTFASSLNEGNSIVLDSSIRDFTPLGGLSVLALGATINLLKENLALEIISEPSILCVDNQESSIYVGETRSIKTGSTITSGGNISDSYSREDIGLRLSVKPRVSGNEILLHIQTTLEDIKQAQTSSGNPITLKKEIKTVAIVKNGESVILGGLIKNKIDVASSDVPFLSDIPILGNLFKNKVDIKDKINLVIIITPYIIKENEDLTYIRKKLSKFKLLENKYTQALKEALESRKNKMLTKNK
ncbi:MAG: hypothetical protein HRT43_13520 [Campylobacteraceae bacterium]|nr:hypothetical protein [Campylobacteraceae bacterium]